MTTYKQRARQQREQEITRIAGQMIRAQGYSNLNMDTLADAVGISKPTLYSHFKSKEELVAHVVWQGSMEIEAFVQSLSDPSPVNRLVEIIHHNTQRHYASDSFPVSHVSPQVIAILSTHTEVLKIRERMERVFHDLIQKGVDQGEIASDIPPRLIINLLFKMPMMIDDEDILQDDDLLRQSIDALLRIFVRGIASS